MICHDCDLSNDFNVCGFLFLMVPCWLLLVYLLIGGCLCLDLFIVYLALFVGLLFWVFVVCLMGYFGFWDTLILILISAGLHDCVVL